MAVSFVRTATGSNGAVSIQSSGEHRLLVVAVWTWKATGGPFVPSGATYDGTAMTRITAGMPADSATFVDANNHWSLWYLIAPSVKTANVAVSFPSGNPSIWRISAHLFEGVDQASPIVDLATSVNLSGTTTNGVTVTSTVDQLIVGFLMLDYYSASPPQPTSGAGQTSILSFTDPPTYTDTKAGAATSTPISWDWAAVGSFASSVYGVALNAFLGGDILLQEHTVAAAGAVTYTSTGALALQEHAIVGAGSFGGIASDGALALQEHAVAAASAETLPSAGALELQEHAIAGASTVANPVDATASIALQEHAIAAAGVETIPSAGALAVQTYAVAAAGLLIQSVTAAAAIALSAFVPAGFGAVANIVIRTPPGHGNRTSMQAGGRRASDGTSGNARPRSSTASGRSRSRTR